MTIDFLLEKYSKLFHVKPSEDFHQKDMLNQFLASADIKLSDSTLDKLYAYADLVVGTKEFGNLISEKDSQKFLSRHIADSLVPYIYIDSIIPVDPVASLQDDAGDKFRQDGEAVRWADMGAGAGCPVFPLAIAMPNIQFYAVEPRNMRVKFMQMVKEKLHLDNLTVVGKRFETSGLADLDFISCRALSTFENDWERAQPALKKGGHFVTLKSFNNIVHLENDPAVSIKKYMLPLEEQVYALVSRGNE